MSLEGKSKSYPALCVSAGHKSQNLPNPHPMRFTFPPVALRKLLNCVEEKQGLCCLRSAIKSLLLSKPLSPSK